MGYWFLMFACNMCVPIIMILGGRMMFRHCPEEINSVFGYRTKRSMKSINAWKFANDYCGRLWQKIGLILIVPTVAAQLLLLNKGKNAISIASLVIISVQTVILLITIIPTENALKKNFDDNGKK